MREYSERACSEHDCGMIAHELCSSLVAMIVAKVLPSTTHPGTQQASPYPPPYAYVLPGWLRAVPRLQTTKHVCRAGPGVGWGPSLVLQALLALDKQSACSRDRVTTSDSQQSTGFMLCRRSPCLSASSSVYGSLHEGNGGRRIEHVLYRAEPIA